MKIFFLMWNKGKNHSFTKVDTLTTWMLLMGWELWPFFLCEFMFNLKFYPWIVWKQFYAFIIFTVKMLHCRLFCFCVGGGGLTVTSCLRDSSCVLSTTGFFVVLYIKKSWVPFNQEGSGLIMWSASIWWPCACVSTCSSGLQKLLCFTRVLLVYYT